MKRILIAAVFMSATLVSASANESLIERISRYEMLTNLETAAYFFGGTKHCRIDAKEHDFFGDILDEPDPDTYAAIARGYAAIGMQIAFNVPPRVDFCKQLRAYMTQNGL